MPLGFEILCKKPVLFPNIFSGNLYFDVLFIGLFYICLFMIQTLGELG